MQQYTSVAQDYQKQQNKIPNHISSIIDDFPLCYWVGNAMSWLRPAQQQILWLLTRIIRELFYYEVELPSYKSSTQFMNEFMNDVGQCIRDTASPR